MIQKRAVIALTAAILLGGLILSGAYFREQITSRFAGMAGEKVKQSNEQPYEDALKEGLEAMSQAGQGDRGALGRAIVAYKRALSFQPTWLSYLNLGNAYRQAGRIKDAQKTYREGIEKTPDEHRLWLALIELERYDIRPGEEEIIGMYRQALQKAPGSTDLHVSYAAYLRDVGRTKEAKEQYDLLLKAYPDDPLFKREVEGLKK